MRHSTFSPAFVFAVVLSVVLPAAAIEAPIYGKCGGDGHKAECPTGYKCQVVNPCELVVESLPWIDLALIQRRARLLAMRSP